MAEGAAEPEPMHTESLLDLFIEQKDPRTLRTCGAGVDFARFQKESKHCPRWFKDMQKSLEEYYPEPTWFDSKKRIWYGTSTPRPPDGILRLNTPYLMNCAEGIRQHKSPCGKWFIAPSHLPGSGCPACMDAELYKQMAHWGKQITTVLRHRREDLKYGDGATMDPDTLADLCSKEMNWKLSVRDIWEIAQEGQGDGKARVMVLFATNHDGSIYGWDKKILGEEPPHDECAPFSYRLFYDKAGSCAKMKFLGFKCIQGMSGTGGDCQPW